MIVKYIKRYMILITQVDNIEAKLSGLESCNIQYKQNKELYAKFIKLYEINFEKYLIDIGKLKVYKEICNNFEYPNREQQEEKLRVEFEKVRPYFYVYNNNFYFFQSPLRRFHEANIFQLEQDDIIPVLEKHYFRKDGLFEKIRRKLCKTTFIKNINYLTNEH